MAYVADGKIVDGSWNLNILVTDLQVEKTLRVTGDLHIGGVMLKLVQALGKFLMLTRPDFVSCVHVMSTSMVFKLLNVPCSRLGIEI